MRLLFARGIVKLGIGFNHRETVVHFGDASLCLLAITRAQTARPSQPLQSEAQSLDPLQLDCSIVSEQQAGGVTLQQHLATGSSRFLSGCLAPVLMG
jgi:hypothetical protein